MTRPQILIVGAGPAGQLAALMLSRHGISSVLIDRRSSPLMAPKAHAINPRTLEICESIGISADRLRQLGAGANDAGHVRFVGTLSGIEFGSLPYERQDKAALEDTPYPLTNIPQPMFEAELTAAIVKDTNIRFQRGIECSILTEADEADEEDEEDGEVSVMLKNLELGDITEEKFLSLIHI